MTTASLEEMFNPARPAGAYDALLAATTAVSAIERIYFGNSIRSISVD